MAAGEMILLYEIEGEKARKLKTIFVQNGIKIKTVAKNEYLKPIGVLTGVLDEAETSEEYEGELLGEEMLVMKGIIGKRLDLLLLSMRKAKAAVSLKAVVTETNMHWNAVQLFQEIKEEHEAMSKGNQ